MAKTNQANTDARTLLARGEKQFQQGNLDKARSLFDAALQQDPDNKVAHNNLGVVAFRQQRLDDAEGHFTSALKLDREYQESHNNLKALRLVRAREDKSLLKNFRIALISPFENKFLKLWSDYFSRENEVRVLTPKTDSELDSLGDWPQIVLSGWCNQPLFYLSHRRPPRVLATYIRSYEALTPGMLQAARWDKIHGAVFVADHVRQVANQIGPEGLGKVRQATIFNCVDTDQYPFYENGPGHDIAYVGYINHKKGIGLLMQCIEQASRLDEKYHFHFAGVFQEARYEHYMKHLLRETGLQDRVTFHGWVKDIQGFLADKNYVISTSPWEGCPNNVIEAMACGVRPLVHNWKGAKDLFGNDLVFDTVDQFTRMLTSEGYDARAYRRIVSERFNAEANLPELDRFLADLCRAEGLDARDPGAATVSKPSETTDAGTSREEASSGDGGTTGLDFVQRLPEKIEYTESRKGFTAEFCRGKRVLHIGCVDAGMMELRVKQNNYLHGLISSVATEVIGVDIDRQGLDVLSDEGYEVHELDLEKDIELLAELADRADVIVVPEVIEHLDNAGLALDNIRSSGFRGDILISTPNAYSYRAIHAIGQKVELIHPDHNYWFSPTTLRVLLDKHGFEISRLVMYYNRCNDAFDRQFTETMKKNPYYGDGLIAIARRKADSDSTEA
jgi:glycosyltransferase involved in cell wall biosynthesis/2-polyprenyl-3-methyl-5-hydroxy-6-metoxy-1,4-benzoquinol methylase